MRKHKIHKQHSQSNCNPFGMAVSLIPPFPSPPQNHAAFREKDGTPGGVARNRKAREKNWLPAL